MRPAEIDRFISYGLLAFLFSGVCWLFGLAVSAAMMCGLGAMSGSFSEWRTERGLWMLGALFLIIFGFFYAVITYNQAADWIAGRAALRGIMAIDWFIGTTALRLQNRESHLAPSLAAIVPPKMWTYLDPAIAPSTGWLI